MNERTELLETKRKGEWWELIVPDCWNNITINEVLKEFWKVPKGILHKFRMEKSVKVNNEVFPWTRELNSGERFQIHLFPKEDLGVEPTFKHVEVLYEDDHLLIVNKPAEMDTHPTNNNQKDTLANAVAYHFLINGISAKVKHIHRLDKDTTGAVLFAKHALAGSIMDRLLEKREIKRTYIALVEGKLKKKKGIINEAIGRDRHHPTRRRVSPTGQKAITYYELVKYDIGVNATIVKLELETGRTHQIRVHMSHIGHPLLGDTLYGGKDKHMSRQALHAAKISLAHPMTNARIQILAPFLDSHSVFKEDIEYYF